MTKPKRVHRDSAFWEKVKLEYQAGATQAELRRKYKISAGTLGMRISREGWQLSQAQKQVVQEFKESVANVSETFTTATKQQKRELIQEVSTALEDSELMINNRKLLKGLQGRLGRMISTDAISTAQDVKAATGAVADIERVANPAAGKPDVQVNTQINQPTTTLDTSKLSPETMRELLAARNA